MFLLKIISKQRFFSLSQSTGYNSMISLSAISHLVTILRVWLLHSAILYNILVCCCFINKETIPQSNITMITYKELGYRTTIV